MSKTPDYYFVIAGGEDQWLMWRDAYMKVCDLEGRLDRDHVKHKKEFVAYITPHHKWVIYRYMMVNDIDAARGRGPFVVIPIGTYTQAWTEEALARLATLSAASLA